MMGEGSAGGVGPERSGTCANVVLIVNDMIYVANVDENSIKDGNKYTKQLSEFIKNKNLNAKMIIVSSKIEMEISSFDEIEKKEYLNSIGCEKSGLDKLVQEGYNLLGLITFFTIGPKEAHAWSILKDKLAPEAAGVIHTDFQKGFIRAETISYNDYIQYNGEDGCKNVGKLRVEGKEYVLQDGDIFHFRFNI